MAGSLADAELTRFLADMYAHPAPPAADVGPDALRAAAEERAAARPPGPDMHTLDVVIPAGELRARVYRPVAGPVPLVLYLHGGGWVIGSIATHDRACRRLAAASAAAVLSVDYRRAPEHPWPAAVDDTMAALRWVAARPAELDPHPPAVAVAGDSAGGTIATLACLRAREAEPGVTPDLQVLIYANTDLTNSGASMQTEGHGYGLEVADVEWFSAQWVPDPAMRRDSLVSPLFAPDLRGLPGAIVITCEHDPLRDQGEAYAQRLRDANVRTTQRRELGMIHNFLLWDLISPSCARAADRVAADVRSALGARRGNTARLDPT
jgi:acetyl esterase